MDDKTFKELLRELELHAKGLGLPPGSTKIFIENSLTTAQKSLSGRSIVTENDITRTITKELRKYNPDLAYTYQNYNKII